MAHEEDFARAASMLELAGEYVRTAAGATTQADVTGRAYEAVEILECNDAIPCDCGVCLLSRIHDAD